MKVKVKQLQPGCILKEDVIGKTKHPIIPADTLINEKHIDFLQAFMIKEVTIRNDFERIITRNKESSQMDKAEFKPKLMFEDHYNQAVSQYKKEFLLWQSGLPVNFAQIRSILIPLLDEVENDHQWIKKIHLYTNEEDYFFHHSIAMGLIASLIAKGLGYLKGQCLQIAFAACLADCGYAKLPLKEVKNVMEFSRNHFSEIEKHPFHSYQMVKHISLLKPESKLAIYQHHESLDGSGYPIKEKGVRIHPYSQLLTVADVYHELTTQRKISSYKALQVMEEEQFGKFNTSMLNVLISSIAHNPIGTLVKLSDGSKGEILYVKPDSLTRPIIQLLEDNLMVDLEKSRNIHIEEIID